MGAIKIRVRCRSCGAKSRIYSVESLDAGDKIPRICNRCAISDFIGGVKVSEGEHPVGVGFER